MAKKSLLSHTIRFLTHHVSRYRVFLGVLFVSVTLARIASSYVATFYKEFVDELSSGSPSAEKLLGILIRIGLTNGGIWVAWRIVTFIDATIPPRVMGNIITSSFNYLQRHSYRFFTDSFAGSLVKRITRLSDSYLTISDNIIYNIYPTVITIIATIILSAQVHASLSIVLGVWILFYLSINYWLALQRMKFENVANQKETRVSAFLSDTISNFMNVITFGAYEREYSSVKKVVEEWRVAKTRSWIHATVHESIQAIMMVLIEFVLFVIGIRLWEQGHLTVGDFVMLQGLLFVLFGRIWDFGKFIRQLGEGFSKAEEMIEILQTSHEVTDNSAAKPIVITQGEIEIRNLTFGYGTGKNVFQNFSLHIPANRKIALVSRSGSGKSTLIKLLLRLYNIPEETIFIDGQDIMKVQQVSLRKGISFVSQEPVLFHRTLAENIAYGKPDATRDEVIEASKKAHCHEFIITLPEGYDTYVGERGIKLSGGERQRVAIARAILEDSHILILDEATSSLDSESEGYIQESLKQLMANKTAIVIAHRLSTIIQMDEIVVIENGRITERGTHTELLKNATGHYKNLWEIQSGGYEMKKAT